MGFLAYFSRMKATAVPGITGSTHDTRLKAGHSSYGANRLSQDRIFGENAEAVDKDYPSGLLQ